MKPLEIILGVHLHQPVGNFGWVLEDVFNQAYKPFLDVWSRYPELDLVQGPCRHVSP